MPFFKSSLFQGLTSRNNFSDSFGTSSTSFSWTIDSFSTRSVMPGSCLDSTVFLDDGSKTKWKLQFYPRGTCEMERKWVALNLSLVDASAEIEVRYRFAVVERKATYRRESHKRYGIKKFSMVETWDETLILPRFVKRKKLFHKTKGTFKNDRLEIICLLDINTELDDSTLANEEHAPTKSGSDCQVIVKHRHDAALPIECCHFTENLEQLLKERRFTDVILEANDGKKFAAHNIVLSAKSSVFSTILKHNQDRLVEIKEANSIVLEQLLKFIYTGKMMEGLSITMAKDLFVIAIEYMIDGLRLGCEILLARKLNEDNVLDILAFADIHGAISLKEEAVHFIVAHEKDMIDSEKFKEAEKAHPKLIIETLRSIAKNKK